VLAGVIGGVPSTLHALSNGENVLAPTRAAGTLLPGRRDQPSVAAGLVAHGVTSVFWVIVLAVVGRGRRLGVLRGAIAGAAIAALDLQVIAPRRAPAVAALPQAPQWIDHVAFGAVVGLTL